MTSASGVSSRPILRFDPEPKAWPTITNRAHPNGAHTDGACTHEHARETRLALGLDVDRPVILSGHQPTLWHPGVLAKRFALQACATASNAQPLWLVVDQDTLDPWVFDVPLHNANGSLGITQIRIGPAPAEAVPMRAVPPITPELVLPPEVPTGVREGLERASALLAEHREAPSAAAQIERVTAALLNDATPAIFASELNTLPGFARLTTKMLDDPAACAQAYNRAVQSHGGARELFCRPGGGEGDWELPLWQLNEIRRPVFASELADLDPRTLAPKALSMTALLRLEVCDLFIHGSGGGATGSDGGYDRAAEAWIHDWLGDSLCPATVVSADLHLDLLDAPAPGLSDLNSAIHLAHSAQHDPGLVGDPGRAHAKRDLVERITASDDRSVRSELFREMHRLIDEHREANREAVALTAQNAQKIRLRLGDAEIAHRRDWSFVMYPEASIESLRQAIQGCWA